MSEDPGEITVLARRWRDGDQAAFDRLIELVYDDLRRIAHHHLRVGKRGETLSTTALVHEAYMKLASVEGGDWPDRGHFLAFCSKAMRRILIDYARRMGAEKRGGALVRIPLTDDLASVEREATEVLALDEALTALETRDARMARVAECRFFGGLSVLETAEAISVSPRTVEREWSRARVYLREMLRDT